MLTAPPPGPISQPLYDYENVDKVGRPFSKQRQGKVLNVKQLPPCNCLMTPTVGGDQPQLVYSLQTHACYSAPLVESRPLCAPPGGEGVIISQRGYIRFQLPAIIGEQKKVRFEAIFWALFGFSSR